MDFLIGIIMSQVISKYEQVFNILLKKFDTLQEDRLALTIPTYLAAVYKI